MEAGVQPASTLEVNDPGFRYHPSKNPYFSKLQGLSEKVFVANQAELRRGRWRELFPKILSQSLSPPTLNVELGCNGGHVLLENAQRDPKNIYVGLDWKFKQIYKAYEKSIKRKLDNVAVIRCHAERLPHIFAENEIDRLALYFPDPWAKTSQMWKRIVNRDWLLAIAPCIKPHGTFELRTDHPGYFEWMIEAVEGASMAWQVLEFTRDRHAGRADATTLVPPEVTLFERIYVREGIPIQRMLLQRKPI